MNSQSRIAFPAILTLALLASACADVQAPEAIECANNFDCDTTE